MHNEDESIKNKNENALGNVFLTGANGFIGIHVLHQLLTTTDSKIYCLVRGANIDFSKKRLFSSYEFYFNKNLDSDFKRRVSVVNGDIALPNLGISADEAESISKDISTVIHSAAIVKHYGDFEEFKNININGTKAIVNFAYKNNLRFIHISSISVSGNYLLKSESKFLLK